MKNNNKSKSGGNLLNIKEIAGYFNVSKSTLYRMVQHREIPAYRVLGSWRFEKSEIKEYLKRHSNLLNPCPPTDRNETGTVPLNTQEFNTLKQYLEECPSVLLAFLFGSCAKGFEMEESDVDIGLYLSNKDEKDDILSGITKILNKEVDLVCLNNAPASLISSIFKTGIPIVIKDRKLYWDLYLNASLEAEDFSRFAEDYFRIYMNAGSLIPEERTRLLERMNFLLDELKEVDNARSLTLREYRDEKVKRRNIERWAENIINTAIDIAKIVLASERKRVPRTYEEALFDLGILAGLTDEESKKLSRFANMRNILAHEYLDILYDRIQVFARDFPPLWEKIPVFLKSLS